MWRIIDRLAEEIQLLKGIGGDKNSKYHRKKKRVRIVMKAPMQGAGRKMIKHLRGAHQIYRRLLANRYEIVACGMIKISRAIDLAILWKMIGGRFKTDEAKPWR